MNELEKALSKLANIDAKKKRNKSPLYLKALREGKIRHDPGKGKRLD